MLASVIDTGPYDNMITKIKRNSNTFFSGNKYLHMLTSQNSYSLRIDMDNFENESRYAEYSTFSVDSDVNKYTLTIGGYSGNAGKLHSSTSIVHSWCLQCYSSTSIY